VLRVQGTHATVTSPVDMLVEVDGEQVGRAPIEVSILPGALRVIGHEAALTKVGGCTNTTL
jgi:diacylglycerol kinase family enzyme